MREMSLGFNDSYYTESNLEEEAMTENRWSYKKIGTRRKEYPHAFLEWRLRPAGRRAGFNRCTLHHETSRSNKELKICSRLQVRNLRIQNV